MKNHYVKASLNYLAPSVASSLYRNGKVYATRDSNGNDGPFHGAPLAQYIVDIKNGRDAEHLTLDRAGFECFTQAIQSENFDFFDQQALLTHYYPDCENLIKKRTGASHVFAFDHNLRATNKTTQHKDNPPLQKPIHYVHGDYTITSAPQRLQNLTEPPRVNDTLQALLPEHTALLSKTFVTQIVDQNKRFAIINVWRNIADTPVLSQPLALCDGQSMSEQDLVVFEIHYDDRIGENYFAKYASSHQWWYYPEINKDEVILIKQWDSAGTLRPTANLNNDDISIPCPFSLHAAFDDPTTPDQAPARQSIEVRCIVIFDE